MTRAVLTSIAFLPWFALRTFSAEPDPGPRGEYVLGVSGDRVAAELLVDASSVAPGDRVRVGVLFDLDPGWHIYWRHSGDSGLATMLSWRGLHAEIGPTQWPAPQVFREQEGLLTTFGYENDVLLTSAAIVSGGAHGKWHLEVDVDFVACLLQCIPGHMQLTREIPVAAQGASPPPAIRDRFDLAESRLPRTPESLGVVVGARASQPSADAGDDIALVLEVISCAGAEPDPGRDCRPWTLDADFADQAFVPVAASNLDLSALGLSQPPAAPREEASGFSLAFTAHAFEDEPHIDRQRLRGIVPLARLDGRAHLAVDVPIVPAADGADPAAFEVVAALSPSPRDEGHPGDGRGPTGVGVSSLGWALVLGLLGGLILNLMPCVLPVLAIKVFGIADLARAERSHIVKHGLAYLVGVLASMAALASVVVALRAAGTAVGWGFQLQNPVFLAVVCTILVVFAMNLFGAFDITLQASGPALGSSTRSASPSRSFFEGTLAVALATPCTAPFLGTAVGFAFASSGVVIFAVFASIGVGLALPYVLVTLIPGWARFVPRPGAWMLRLREVLGFSLLATVVWLAWVAGREVGVDAQGLLLAHLIAIAFLVWIFGTVQAAARPIATRVVAVAVVGLAVVSITALPLAPPPPGTSSGAGLSSDGINWLPFDPSAVDRERAAGRPVFVDFTADWCITCKVNETVVLADEAVQEELARWKFATFKADWTLRDDEITGALAQWGRAGVPMYLVYPADPSRPPELLPELLTLDATLEALRAAGGAGGA
jgi:thiol:disulfide interchange protein DsbD